MKVSVIISFYNKIDFLKLVIAGFERQTFKDFELIISDDGSKSEIVEEVRQLIQSSSVNIQHVWHEDLGWRKNIMLNKSIMSARSNYLIFVDGIVSQTRGLSKIITSIERRIRYWPEDVFNCLKSSVSN